MRLTDRFDVMALQLSGEPVPAPPALPGREIRGRIPTDDPFAERWVQQHPERIGDHFAHCRLMRHAAGQRNRQRDAAKQREKRAAAAAQRKLDRQAAAWAEAERDYQAAALGSGVQPRRQHGAT